MLDLDVVAQLYAALEAGDRAAYHRLLAPDVDWWFMDGFPHGGRRVGVDAVIGATFEPLMADFDEWHIDVEELMAAPDAVIGLGRYRGRARSTGRPVEAAFCHVFRVRDGWVVEVRQYTDTVQFERAMAPAPPGEHRR